MNQIIYKKDIKKKLDIYLTIRTNKLKNNKVKCEYNKFYKGSLLYLVKLNLERHGSDKRSRSYLFFEFIDQQLENILIGKVSILLNINQQFEQKFKLNEQIEFYECDSKITPIWIDLKSVLNNYLFVYDKLKAEKKLIISAVKNKLCPYCSRNYINLIDGVNHNMGVNLDHYYSKSKYPLLAISFFNLIPSCQTCNSAFKGKIEFDRSYIHPSQDSIESGKFTLKLVKSGDKYSALYFLKEKNFEIDYVPNFVETYKQIDYYKFKKSVHFFKLKEIYNAHKDIIQRTLIDYYVYKEGAVLKSIQKTFPKLNLNHKALGISTSKKDWLELPFGKLKYDVLSALLDNKVNEKTNYNEIF